MFFVAVGLARFNSQLLYYLFMKKSLLFSLGLCAALSFFTACDDDDDPEYTDIVTFEGVDLGTAGYDDQSTFVYDSVLTFVNNHATWGSYFGVSSLTDTVTAGYTNDASVFGKGGNFGSKCFGYCYYSEFSQKGAVIELIDGNKAGVKSVSPNRVFVALNTYAALALRDGNDGYYGDAVKLKQGGYFSVTFTGFLGEQKTGSVTAYPGDFRGASLQLMTTWTAVDLKQLGSVDQIEVTIGGSEDLYGEYGFNAPAYIAIDDFSFTRNM